MKELILLGGGGHCKACIDVIESEAKYRILGILDSADKVGQSILGYEYLGTDDDIQSYVDLGVYFLITVGQIGSSSLREKLAKMLSSRGAKIATVISKRAYISKSASVGVGSIVMHDSLINAEAEIGVHCIINSKALIEHESIIGGFCHISTGAIVNGGVKVGTGSFLGSNGVTKQGVTIPSYSFVKAGSRYNSRKEKPRVAFLTTLFPVPVDYIRDFLRSLSNQTYKLFDLILMNDGYGDFHGLKEEFASVNIIEIASKGTIAKNREELIKYSLHNGYDIAIFGDIDDYFSENRVQLSVENLVVADIVVNELSPFSEVEKPSRRIITNRLSGFASNPLTFILDKNIFGLSNTAVNLRKVDASTLDFPDDIIAVDWYFYSILLLSGLSAVFTEDTTTFYRQHIGNIVGASDFSAESLRKAVKVRLGHYSYMSKIDQRYKILYEQELGLCRVLEDEAKLKKIVSKNQRELNSPLWWEVTL